MNDIRLTFNEAVQVNAGATATLTDDDTDLSIGTVNSTSMTVDTDDPKTVIVSFAEQTLYNSIKYTVTVPEGAVSLASDGTVSNKEFTLTYTGTEYRYFGVKSVTPAEDGTAIIPDVINVTPDFPKGCGFVYLSTKPTYEMKLYKGADASGECLATFNGELNEGGFSLDFDVDYPYEENTEYTFVMEDGMIKPYITGSAASKYRQDYIFSRTELHYTTVKSSDLPALSVTGCTPASGSDLDYLGRVDITVGHYTTNGSSYKLGKNTDIATATLYEADADNAEYSEVKSVGITLDSYSRDLYIKDFGANLYAGKTYKLVIPAGAVYPKNEFLKQFVKSEEAVFYFTGTADPNGITVSGGIADGKELPELGVVAYYAEGAVTAADGAVVKLMQGETLVKEAPVVVASASGSTMLVADFCDESHAPLTLEEGAAYTLVLPQGSVVGSDGIMTNAEKATAVTGATTVTEPELAAVTLTIDNASTVSQAVKGKAYTVTVAPEADWTVESLTVGGEDVTSEMSNGSYTIAELKGDTEIIATLAYDESKLTFADVSTGIASVEGTDIKAYSEGSEIVVEGLAAGDTVTVYTVGGMRLASHKATQDSVRIAAPAGATYIVKVNSHAIKLAH